MPKHIDSIAIIGGGLGGCAIAIALAKQGLPVTVYEARPQDDTPLLQSGVLLSPNGLRVLSHLRLYDRIKDKCYLSTHRCFKNDRDETVKKIIAADEVLHGFCNHRLWRSVLLNEMKGLLADQRVTVQYGARLEGVIREDGDAVKFLINGSPRHATFVIAADGIHSTVRKVLAPDVEPEYTGVTGVIAHIPRASVAWPYKDYEPNATIQGKPGAVFFLPEDPDLKDIMVGLQVKYPEQSRADLERLQQDKDRQVAFFQCGFEDHGATAQSIIDSVVAHKETCYIWPFMKMPRLERWFSSTGRIIIIGDAAHALPPSSAQGINQALEDAYSLALLLGTASKTAEFELTTALASWQSRRERRIDDIFDWATGVVNISRLSGDERAKLEAEGRLQSRLADDMSWLYGYHVEEEFSDFILPTPHCSG